MAGTTASEGTDKGGRKDIRVDVSIDGDGRSPPLREGYGKAKSRGTEWESTKLAPDEPYDTPGRSQEHGFNAQGGDTGRGCPREAIDSTGPSPSPKRANS